MGEKNKGGNTKTDLTPILALEEEIIGWFRNGLSIIGVLSQLHSNTGIYLPKSTLYDILKRVDKGEGSEDEHRLSDLINTGRMYSQCWWENTGRNNLIGTKEGGTLNAGVYNKMISNMFPDDYKEKQQSVEVTTESSDVVTKVSFQGGEIKED